MAQPPPNAAEPCTADAIVVIGVAGSGKSTIALALARQTGRVFIDADDLHAPDARAQMAAGVPLSDMQREPWVASLAQELRRHAAAGHAAVLAWSGLRAAHRQRLRESGVPLRFVHLHAAPSVIAARLAARQDHFMPLQLLASQLEALEDPVAEPDVVEVDVDEPPAQVVARVLAALGLPGTPGAVDAWARSRD